LKFQRFKTFSQHILTSFYKSELHRNISQQLKKVTANVHKKKKRYDCKSSHAFSAFLSSLVTIMTFALINLYFTIYYAINQAIHPIYTSAPVAIQIYF